MPGAVYPATGTNPKGVHTGLEMAEGGSLPNMWWDTDLQARWEPGQ